MQVYAAKKAARQPWSFGNQGYFGGNQPAQKVSTTAPVTLIKQEDKEGVSLFKLAIRGGQQGLAYLMLDNGYDLMLAMQDAMD